MFCASKIFIKNSIYGTVYVFENYINIQYCINDLFFPVIHILYLYLKIILYNFFYIHKLMFYLYLYVVYLYIIRGSVYNRSV